MHKLNAACGSSLTALNLYPNFDLLKSHTIKNVIIENIKKI